jgi:glutaredoxin/glutathione-dependent peroxiredoxin
MMTIATGERLPDGKFKIMEEGGAREIDVAEIFDGKKVILFGVPGAFTPTCNNNHLPGYLENYDALLAKGIDNIAVVAVNDVFVMGAWARFSAGEGKVMFLADGAADYARALGLDIDLSAAGMGLRVKRFSMLVEDRVVKELFLEEKPGQAVDTGATRMLEALDA